MSYRIIRKRSRRFYNPIDWAVTALAVLLLCGAVLGMVKVYFVDAHRGLNSMNMWERYCMSVRPVPDENGESDHLEKRPVSVYGEVTARDGTILFDAFNRTVKDEAFGSLLGSVNDAETEGTRYILPNYYEYLWGDVEYDPLTGVRGGAKNVGLTLDPRVQNRMYTLMRERGVIGSITAYDYHTGSVSCLATTPGWQLNGDGSWINRCLCATTPGSTQKLLAHLVLTEAGAPVDEAFTCTGEYTLHSTGDTIRCPGAHGSLRGRSDALGVSCNCYFAHQIETYLDMNRVKVMLTDVGVSVNGFEQSASLGRLPIDPPSVSLVGDSWTFSNTWCLIGQADALQSPLWMVELAADYMTGGEAVKPRLTTDEETRRSGMGQRWAGVFAEGYPVWKAGFDNHYTDCHELITCAKSGTADDLGMNLETHKTLCLASEELGVAAYITVENYDDCGVMPNELAGELMDSIWQSQCS
jgi:hypothetical protein